MGMYNNAVPQQPPNNQPMMHQPPNQPPIHQGQQQQQQPPPNNHTQASLPSPLYPWMRSQFGKLGLFHSNFIFLLIKLTQKCG
jgi:Antp family protein